MPFLHYETYERQINMAETINSVRADPRLQPPPNACPDHYLFHAYLNHIPPLHPRRTLDQYLYYGIDTTARDSDQVVYRHCLRSREEPKVFMVDQLWLFVLGSGKLLLSRAQNGKMPCLCLRSDGANS